MEGRGSVRRAVIVAVIGVLCSVCSVAGPPRAVASWTQWGGPDRNFTVDSARLASEWPEGGPTRLWSRALGVGYSGVLFENGRLYTMFRDGEDEVVVALDADSGQTIWQYRYAASPSEDQTAQFGGGPNATPLIAGDFLCSVGFSAKLHCLSKHDGSLVWSRDLVEEFDGATLQFGYSSSPVAHGSMVVVLVGGRRHGAIGFDRADGAIRWKTPPIDISYASPIVIDVDGQDQLVFMTPTEVVGTDLENGNIQWRHHHENQYKSNCAGPWWGEDNLLFVSSQGDAGGRTLQLTGRDGRTTVEEVARDRKMKIFHNTGVRLGQYLYAGSHEFVAAHNVRTGVTAWKERGFSEANVLFADGKMILLDENGQLGLATVTPKTLTVHARAQVLDKPAWTPPTLVGTRLFVRGKHELIALDLGPAKSTP